nr:hypothetical protein Iba_chr09dCG0880 [Ipomoea batatas]
MKKQHQQESAVNWILNRCAMQQSLSKKKKYQAVPLSLG